MKVDPSAQYESPIAMYLSQILFVLVIVFLFVAVERQQVSGPIADSPREILAWWQIFYRDLDHSLLTGKPHDISDEDWSALQAKVRYHHPHLSSAQIRKAARAAWREYKEIDRNTQAVIELFEQTERIGK